MNVSKSAIILHGKPGSGKTSASLDLLSSENEFLVNNKRILHLSIGAVLRGILSGTETSSYLERVKKEASNIYLSEKVDNQLVNDLVEERIKESSEEVIFLLDGYPLYPEQIEGFINMTRDCGVHVLGIVEIVVSDEVALNRMLARGQRESEQITSIEFLQSRVNEYNEVISQTVSKLGSFFPVIKIDGSSSLSNTVSLLAKQLQNLALS